MSAAPRSTLAGLDDLAALVANLRGRGAKGASVDTDQLADWLAGWRADRVRIVDAEDDAQRWKRRARRRQALRARGARGARGGGR